MQHLPIKHASVPDKQNINPNEDNINYKWTAEMYINMEKTSKLKNLNGQAVQLRHTAKRVGKLFFFTFISYL